MKGRPLIETDPLLAAQLVNQELASELTRGSNKKVDWMCPSGHPYPATVANRSNGRGCPFCTSPYLSALATKDLEFARKVLQQIRSQEPIYVNGQLCKLCTRCFDTKPIDDFYKAASSHDGHKSYCKKCGRADTLKWAGENYEHVLEKSRQWYYDNAERGIARSKEWASKNREKRREIVRGWDARNPEVKRSQVQRRRTRIKGGTTEKFVDHEIFERDLWICQLCGEPIDRSLRAPNPLSVSLDHIMPISKGGNHSRDNVQTAHLSCNQFKSDKIKTN